MRIHSVVSATLPILAAVLLAAPFLSANLFPFAWFCFVPLFYSIHRTSNLKRALLVGWLMGLCVYLIGFHWLGYTIKVYGGFNYIASGLIFVLFILYSGLSFAIFAFLVRACGFGSRGVYPAILWIAIEFWFPKLFSWNLGNSQSDFLTLIQWADLTGPYGTSFLLVWINSVFFRNIQSFIANRCWTRAAIGDLVFVCGVSASILIYGYLRFDNVRVALNNAPTLSLSAIQPNIGIDLKWDPVKMESNLTVHKNLTKQVYNTSLVVWPENSIESWLPENLSALPSQLVPELPEGSFFLFGSRSVRQDASKFDNGKVFNSVFLSDSQGIILGHYHKQVLLPFGEYIPLSWLLSRIPGVPTYHGAFSPGSGPETLNLPDGLKIAPLICYEDVPPHVARSFVAQGGAHLLLNLTNDAWFGNTVAPWQHLRLASWRAVETRRALIRVTNTGVTSVIDPTGRIVEILPVFTPAILTAKVPIMKGETYYVRFGDWFAWLNTFLAIGIFVCRCISCKGSWSDTKHLR